MMKGLLTLAVVTALTVLVINALPDLRRYLKIRGM